MFKVGDKVVICYNEYRTPGEIIEIEGYGAPYIYRIIVEGYGSNWFKPSEVFEMIDPNDVMKEVVNGP